MEAVVELDRDLLGVHVTAPGRRELHGKRDAVEPMADLRDGGRVDVVDRERGSGSSGAVDEETDRVVLGQRFDHRSLVGRRRRRQ